MSEEKKETKMEKLKKWYHRNEYEVSLAFFIIAAAIESCTLVTLGIKISDLNWNKLLLAAKDAKMLKLFDPRSGEEVDWKTWCNFFHGNE